MPIIKKEFGQEVSRRLKEKGWSYRRAKIASGIDHYTIGEMASGVVPTRGKVIEWAQALKEPINQWLELAGYDPIPTDLVCDPYPTLEELMSAVVLALDREDKLRPDIKRRLLASIQQNLEKVIQEKAPDTKP